jgi:hypothetical protein
MRLFSKITPTILAIGFGVIAVLAIGYIVFQDQFNRFDIQHVKSNPSFKYADTLNCHVVYTTFKKIGESSMDNYAKADFTLTGLRTDTPKLNMDGFEYTLKKTFEGNTAVTLQSEPVAPDDASIQNIQILKDRGTFVRTYMGTGQYFGSREVFYSDGFQLVIAQKGRCE